MNLSEKNYYELLDIPTSATAEEIHQGYVQAKNAYGQDSIALYSLMTKDECDAIIELVEEAYSILSEPNKRILYDEARGFNQGVKHETRRMDSPSDLTTTPETPTGFQINTAHDSTPKQSMTKIVAQNRFALDFKVDSEMEQEIETCSEFSGEFLKKIREYKNVDIPRLADMTKVSKTYLINIENEELEKLPALVYVRGFIYQYAKCLKLNPDLVATSYLHRIKKMRGES